MTAVEKVRRNYYAFNQWPWVLSVLVIVLAVGAFLVFVPLLGILGYLGILVLCAGYMGYISNNVSAKGHTLREGLKEIELFVEKHKEISAEDHELCHQLYTEARRLSNPTEIYGCGGVCPATFWDCYNEALAFVAAMREILRKYDQKGSVMTAVEEVRRNYRFNQWPWVILILVILLALGASLVVVPMWGLLVFLGTMVLFFVYMGYISNNVSAKGHTLREGLKEIELFVEKHKEISAEDRELCHQLYTEARRLSNPTEIYGCGGVCPATFWDCYNEALAFVAAMREILRKYERSNVPAC